MPAHPCRGREMSPSRSRTSGRLRVEAIASAGSGIGVSRLADVGIVHRQMAAAAEVERSRSWTSAAVVVSQRRASTATSLRRRAGLLVGPSRVRLGRRRRDAHLWRGGGQLLITRASPAFVLARVCRRERRSELARLRRSGAKQSRRSQRQHELVRILRTGSRSAPRGRSSASSFGGSVLGRTGGRVAVPSGCRSAQFGGWR